MEKFDVTARLEMVPHPAGGYYKESYSSLYSIPNESQPTLPQPMGTAMYYLLGTQDECLFHSSNSEEVWNFLYGYPVDIYLISQNETISIITLGCNVGLGETPQVTIPPYHLFGMKLHGRQKPGRSFLTYNPEAFALMSCFSIPGFVKDSVQYFSEEEIKAKFPNCTGLDIFYEPK